MPARLLDNVLFRTMTVPPETFHMPPPLTVATLPLMTVFCATLRVPSFHRPPPLLPAVSSSTKTSKKEATAPGELYRLTRKAS